MDLSFDFVRDSTKKDSPTGATGRTPRFEVPADSDDRSQATTVPLLFRPQGLASKPGQSLQTPQPQLQRPSTACSSALATAQQSGAAGDSGSTYGKDRNASITPLIPQPLVPPKGPETTKDTATGHKLVGRTILVSERQRGNDLLKFIRNTPWEFSDIQPDFVMGEKTCAIFLSLRYHVLHPEYIYHRFAELHRHYTARILLLLIDSKDMEGALKEVTKAALVNKWTLLLSWSLEEAARYVETFRAYEKRQADIIQHKVESDMVAKWTDVLTTIRSVNKTDVLTLAATFGTLERVMNASIEELMLCPGLGAKKAQRVHDAFHTPFKAVAELHVGDAIAGRTAPGQAAAMSSLHVMADQ